MDVPRYVVTGAGGFVGTGLVRRLAARVPVLAMGRALPPALPQAARAIAADIAEPLANVPEFRGATVVHAAAVMNAADDEVYWRANVTGTFHVLDWARRHDAQQFIFFSTGGVYPYARGVRHRETDRLEPIGFYGHTKYLGEELTRAFHTLHQLPVTVVRLFFPFGTGQRRGMIPLIARAVRDGGQLVIKCEGAPRINPVHVEDLIDAVERIAGAPRGWRAYNVCGDAEHSFLDIVRMFEQRLGHSARLEFTNEEQGDLMGDNSAIKRELGWAPRHGVESALDLPFDD